MAEAKVFPINTFVSVLRGQSADQAQLEMLEFLTGTEIDADFAPVAQALAKAAIYEQEPALTKYAEGDLSALGPQVKIAPMECEATVALLAGLTELKAAKDAAEAAASAAEGAKKAADKEMKDLKAKLKTYEDFSAAGEKKIVASSTKVDQHITKLNELLAEVEKVKKEGVVVAGVAAADGAAPAAGAPADGPAVGGEPEADFGLGSDAFGGDW